MIVWGIILIFIGLCAIEENGLIFLLAGIGLLIAGIAKNSSDKSKKADIDFKISFIIDFMLYLYNNCNSNDKQSYSNALSYWRNLQMISFRLNSNGINQVNETYDLIKKDVDKLRSEILSDFNDYCEYNETCPLAVSSDNLLKMKAEIKSSNNFKNLDTIASVIRYLMLVNTNLEISKIGYSKYNVLPGMPSSPKKIHVEAFQLFITKIYFEDKESNILSYMYNNLFDSALFSKGVENPVEEIKRFFKKVLNSVEKAFEEKDIEEIVPILLFVDPNFQKNYNPNKKSYKILGLSPNATREEIDKAYKKLLITSHPDRGGDEKKWAEINEAYTKIKNTDNDNNVIDDNSSKTDDADIECNKEELEEKKEIILALGKKNGYITNEQIAEELKGLDVDADAFDDLCDFLQEHNINVVTEKELNSQKTKMTCEDCGAYVDEDAKVCPKCGAVFEDEAEEDDDESDSQKTKMTCEDCGTYVDEDAKVCPKCGAVFEDEDEEDDDESDSQKTKMTCEDCGAYVDEDAKVCPKCGAVFEDDEE